MEKSKYVSVTSDIKTAGASVWWRLSGELTREDLARRLEDEGLDPEEWMPHVPSAERCFGRAVKSLYKSKDVNIESLKGGGYAVINKKKSTTDVEHTTEFAVKYTGGKVIDAGSCQSLFLVPVDRISAETDRFAATVIADDISSWLISSAEKLGAVSLRDRGGIYFIPNGALDTWRKLASALVKASTGKHTIYSMTTMHEDDAVAAILDALTNEAEDFFTSCSEKIALDKIGGKRAIKNRMTDTEKLLSKILSYEDLLGRKLETLTEQVGDCELELSAALLKAEETDDTKVRLAL